MTMNKTILILAIGTMVSMNAFGLEPLPIPKTGHCPNEYRTEGSYCVPFDNGRSRYAIQRERSDMSCPSGYSVNGLYCVANRGNDRKAIPKSGQKFYPKSLNSMCLLRFPNITTQKKIRTCFDS